MLIQSSPQSPRKDRIILVLIMGAFILPLMSAWILVEHWRPDSKAHHGELLLPARPVTHFQALDVNELELTHAYLKGHWTMVYMGAQPDCNESCRQGLYKIRQVRLALGKEMDRVQRLLLMVKMPDAVLTKWLRQEHAGMTVGVADAATRDFLVQAFSGRAIASGWIYLIDPLSNLVMRYPAESDPQGILKDLKRLLKLSRIG